MDSIYKVDVINGKAVQTVLRLIPIINFERKEELEINSLRFGLREIY